MDIAIVVGVAARQEDELVVPKGFNEKCEEALGADIVILQLGVAVEAVDEVDQAALNE